MQHIVKGRLFLGFDADGHHEWKTEHIDAIRFATAAEAAECCRPYFKEGAKIKPADQWDGHYESYLGHEVQVFRDKHRDIPGGKRWRARYGSRGLGMRATVHVDLTRGYTRPEAALATARRAIEAAEPREVV